MVTSVVALSRVTYTDCMHVYSYYQSPILLLQKPWKSLKPSKSLQGIPAAFNLKQVMPDFYHSMCCLKLLTTENRWQIIWLTNHVIYAVKTKPQISGGLNMQFATNVRKRATLQRHVWVSRLDHLRDRQRLPMYTRLHKRTVPVEVDMGASLSIIRVRVRINPNPDPESK